ncbi:hypothetical protein RF805_003787 [Salmonella enterica]|nr:hypothetical protein [Salmonella enterica]ELE3799305.1 hypothetical protein [Salmonella enterica]
MEPVIKRPEKLAKERLTSKVRYQRNIDLIAALKSGNRSMVAAIEYMKKGFSLDARGGIREWAGLNHLGDFCDSIGITLWEVHHKGAKKEQAA